jgi:hypothetical protein
VARARFFRNRKDLKDRSEDFTSEFLCAHLRSSAVSLPLSQPCTGHILKDLKGPKQAGWNFGFRASFSAIQACPLKIARHGTSGSQME